MSILEKLDELEKGLDPDSRILLKEVKELVAPHEPDIHVARLRDAVLSQEEVDKDRLHDLVDALHSSTARYNRPDPLLLHAYKKDMGHFFSNCHSFIDMDMNLAVFEYLVLYHKVFSEPRKICGLLRGTCHVKDCPGQFDYGPDIICPVCGAYRALCRNQAATNGRCRQIPRHGGRAISGSLSNRTKYVGRAKTYRDSLNGELERMFVEAITDPNYLSVAPEIAALATRSGELISQIGDSDYLAISASVQQATRKMRRAITEQEYSEAESQAHEIEKLLTNVADDKRRWDEIAALTGRLGRLAETERKRLIEEQKMITIQEMYALREETLTHIRDAASVVAAELMKMIRKDREINQRWIKNKILSTLHAVMKGDIKADYYIDREDRVVEQLEQSVTVIDAE